eukprot:448019-Prymnesium_polylepis.1
MYVLYRSFSLDFHSAVCERAHGSKAVGLGTVGLGIRIWGSVGLQRAVRAGTPGRRGHTWEKDRAVAAQASVGFRRG